MSKETRNSTRNSTRHPEMVERVAKAISREQGLEVGEAPDWADWHWEECADLAKAAIAAMAEPTPEMKERGSPYMQKSTLGEEGMAYADACWRAMIDAALSSPKYYVADDAMEKLGRDGSSKR